MPIDARPGVTRSPVPLSFSAGATTVTSTFATLRSAVTSTSMPGAFTPSSFVTSTRNRNRSVAAPASAADTTEPERDRQDRHQTPAHAANVAERSDDQPARDSPSVRRVR